MRRRVALASGGIDFLTGLRRAAVGFLKRSEGIDYYDRNTNFNPFPRRVD